MSDTFSELETSHAAPPSSASMPSRTNLRIVMQDGVDLVGDLYLPAGSGPWPVIVERTPYGAATLKTLGEIYAGHGYLFLAVDVRGRYRSGGIWDPAAHEKSDGPEVLQWAARLPECNGRVGTRGHSYSGMNQLLAAPLAGPCLRAMVCSSAPADPFENVPFQGGAYDLSDYMWAWQNTGATSQPDDNSPAADLRVEQCLTSRPLIDADIRLGLRNPFIREWMQHWRRDDYWKARSWLPGLPGTQIPTLHLSGWWDNNGRGSVLAYHALGGKAGTQRLVLGPWNHQFKTPWLDDLPEPEQALVAQAAKRDVFRDELAWFDRYLKADGPLNAGTRELPSAEIFITGAWRWIEAAEWPPQGVTVRPWYLTAGGGVNQTAIARGERQYHFDPTRPNSVRGKHFPVELAPHDTSQDVRDDVLVYRSKPLEQEMLALGDVRVLIRGATTARDIDWVARLVDEYPDGRSICLRDGILRARFRNGYARPRLPVPNKPADYTVVLWHVGHLFRPGHRVRVEICSSALGRWDVNPGDGGDLATSTTPVPSVQTVFHGGLGGTRLFLSQCPAALAAELLTS
jgi:putative CocE/NonD family hydrolase